jgi:hypothetical protein
MLVTLEGSASADPDGDPLSFRWTQVGGPPVVLFDAGSATPSFRAPTTVVASMLVFALTVDDGAASSAPDAAVVTVNAGVDLTHAGSIIARVTEPRGLGSRSLEVIRDGDRPPPGTQDALRQYDTFDGVDAASEDWIGYAFAGPMAFTRVVFQEGRHFGDGGWFETLGVEVRQGGEWLAVSGLVVDPPYPGRNDGTGFQTYTLDFAPIGGDAIRLAGSPGGSADFISVAELQVLGRRNTAPVARAGADQNVAAGQEVVLDGSASSDPDGDLLAHHWSQTSGPAVALASAGPARVRFVAPPGPATLTFVLTVDDGLVTSLPTMVVVRVDAEMDLSLLGTIIARVTAPRGLGSRSLEVIRDGDLPPPGTSDPGRQYDTWDGNDAAAEDWIGYAYGAPHLFSSLVFQEGMHFRDGGWFDTLAVQVRRDGVWTDVAGLAVEPAYAGASGAGFRTYDLRFVPVAGDAIRLFGAPGGTADFISVAELRAYGLPDGAAVDVTAAGTIVARVTTPLGTGSRSPEVIRDGDEPPALSRDSRRQYDTWDGNEPAVEDWIGYVYARPQLFTGLRFHEGINFPDGGWFDTLTVQVQQGGQWVDVTELDVEPPYDPGKGSRRFARFSLDFAPVVGTGIRLYGVPGGSAAFISVAELRAFAIPGLGDLTHEGTIIARVTTPLGLGSRSLEVIRDGDRPEPGSTDPARQYDTWDGANAAAEDWIGYAYDAPRTFSRVVFQEGRHFNDGGWFETLTVQVRQDGAWVEVPGLRVTPPYTARNDGRGFETYTLDFDPVTGEAIRLYGVPGGSADFVSVAELEVLR